MTITTHFYNRYDARLLLESLPSFDTSQPADGRQSPTGWSDLPSDTEDTFFFSPEETEDFHREKRRRIIEQSREDRLKALRAEREEEPQEDIWGGSDEEVRRKGLYVSKLDLLTCAQHPIAGRGPERVDEKDSFPSSFFTQPSPTRNAHPS